MRNKSKVKLIRYKTFEKDFATSYSKLRTKLSQLKENYKYASSSNLNIARESIRQGDFIRFRSRKLSCELRVRIKMWRCKSQDIILKGIYYNR